MVDTETWKLVLDCLKQDIPVAVLVVVACAGSSPGTVGAKIAVGADERLSGTIGGGNVERKLVNDARKLLSRGKSLCQLASHRHKPVGEYGSAMSSGMICGGEQTTAIYICTPRDHDAIKTLLDTLQHHQNGLLRLNQNGILFELDKSIASARPHFNQYPDRSWVYEENIGFQDTAYLIGGGHISLALSRILATLNFYIVIIDPRAEIKTLSDNDYAHKKIITSFTHVREHVPDGEHNYAIIMTPSHTTDELVLKQLLKKNLRYLAMLGSTSKVITILRRLEQSTSKTLLTELRAPAGIKIQSHTPAEIAVSIAAEMINVRNSR